MKWDSVIAGAGISGIVAANRLAGAGENVLLIEKRNHIGGNCHDCLDDSGVLVHLYGPHIFHTKSERVWDYMSGFTGWRDYEHKVLARIDGRDIPLPFNLNSIERSFDDELAKRLSSKLVDVFGDDSMVPVLDMLRHPDEDVRMLAGYVYDKVFLNYTLKQWGIRPEEIDRSVTARVPVFAGRDDRYFRDPYQGMPSDGYTTMFERMLDKPEIKIMLGCDYREVIADIDYARLIYTGPVDTFFDYRHGRLPYRALDFSFETFDKQRFQDVAVVNYPNDFDFTRITEFRHLTGQIHEKTTIVKEYPQPYRPGENIPCYPVHDMKSAGVFKKYMNEMELAEDVIFLGRLAEFKYYNMDEAVKKSLEVCDRLIMG